MILIAAWTVRQIVDVVLVYGLIALIGLVLVTVGSAASRVRNGRWRGLSDREVFRESPDAAFYVAWGRLLPRLARATFLVLFALVALGVVRIAL